jgi:hypothetical protein
VVLLTVWKRWIAQIPLNSVSAAGPAVHMTNWHIQTVTLGVLLKLVQLSMTSSETSVNLSTSQIHETIL